MGDGHTMPVERMIGNIKAGQFPFMLQEFILRPFRFLQG